MKIKITEDQLDKIKTVNLSDTEGIWDPHYHIHKNDEKQPYEMISGYLVQVTPSRYSGQKTYYFITGEEAKAMNSLKAKIKRLQEQYEDVLRTFPTR
jgi:hypothetical protein